MALAVAPACCAAWSARAGGVLLTSTTAPPVLEFAASREARRPLPDRARHARPHDLHQAPAVLRAGRGPAGRSARRCGPAVTAAVERFVADYTAYFEAHNTRGREAHRSVPAGDRGGRARHCSPRARTAGPPASSTTSTTTRSRCSARPTAFGRLRLALGAGGLRRRVLAAGALQAHAGPAREGAGPAHRAGHRRGERHRPRRGPAAGRRGRARGGDRSRRGGRRARSADEIAGATGAGAAIGLGMDVTQRGLGAGGLRGGGARLRRASTSWSPTRASRTPRRSIAWSSPTGSAPSR